MYFLNTNVINVRTPESLNLGDTKYVVKIEDNNGHILWDRTYPRVFFGIDYITGEKYYSQVLYRSVTNPMSFWYTGRPTRYILYTLGSDNVKHIHTGDVLTAYCIKSEDELDNIPDSAYLVNDSEWFIGASVPSLEDVIIVKTDGKIEHTGKVSSLSVDNAVYFSCFTVDEEVFEFLFEDTSLLSFSPQVGAKINIISRQDSLTYYNQKLDIVNSILKKRLLYCSFEQILKFRSASLGVNMHSPFSFTPLTGPCVIIATKLFLGD